MSPIIRRDPFAGIHGRARELAALRLDEPLPAADDAWLEEHLAGCEACDAVAASYHEQQGLLRSLRGAEPEAPRDLWARTSAAMEAGGRSAARRAGRPSGFGRLPLAPLAGLMVIAVAVGAGLLNGVNLFPPHESTLKGDESPLPTPIAMTAGEVQFLAVGEDGVLELSTKRYKEVCPVGADACGTTAEVDSTKLSGLADIGAFDAVISPARDQIVVMPKGTRSGGVFVVPVGTAVTATPAPATPTPGAATPSPTAEAVTTAPSATPDVSSGPDLTSSPVATQSAGPTTTTSPSESPTATSEPSESPEASAEATPEPTTSPAAASPSPEAPTPTASVAVTPAPDGTIEIAHDVILIGSVSGYSPDGKRFAFTARPSDGSAGPDVYVWRTTDSEAHAVTSDHASLFAAWLGDRLVVSRVADDNPMTVVVDPATGDETAVEPDGIWRPTVDPTSRSAVWWDGKLAMADDGFTWLPATGRLVLGSWPDTGDHRALTAGTVHDWQVTWDEAGTSVAVWVAGDQPGAAGRLSLYAVDEKTGIADLDHPLLEAAPAFDGVSLVAGRLAWSAPADGGDTTVEVLAWSGDTVGRLQVLTEGETTVVR